MSQKQLFQLSLDLLSQTMAWLLGNKAKASEMKVWFSVFSQVLPCVDVCMHICLNMHVRVGAGYWKIVYTAEEEAVCRYLIPEDGYRIKKYVFSSLFKNTTFHNGVIKIIIWGLIELTGASWAFCFIVLFIFFNLMVFYATFRSNLLCYFWAICNLNLGGMCSCTCGCMLKEL